MDTPLVSVVIVTRNRSSVLSQCLKSVFSQDYPALEVIVVDNNSTDDTTQMLATHYPSAIILNQSTNTGAIKGRNIGVQKAQGEICIFIDDDAEFVDNYAIRKSTTYFTKDKMLCCLSMRVIDEHDKIVHKLIPRRDRKHIQEDSPGAMFAATGCALRRSVFLEVGGFWEDLTPYFGGEPELSYRMLDKGYGIIQTPHILVRHFETPLERDPSRRIYYGTRNTPWLTLRNMPWYSFVSLTILAWGYFFLIATKHGHLRAFFRAILASIKHWPAVYRIRKPIGKEAITTIWAHSGIIVC